MEKDKLKIGIGKSKNDLAVAVCHFSHGTRLTVGD